MHTRIWLDTRVFRGSAANSSVLCVEVGFLRLIASSVGPVLCIGWQDLVYSTFMCGTCLSCRWLSYDSMMESGVHWSE